MEKILKEIEELKTRQLTFNNLMLENGKQNEMIFVVLKELLSELREEKEKGSLKEVIENILKKLDILIEKLDELEGN
jgi:DNA replication protein DnaC